MQLALSNPQATEALHAEVIHIESTGETVIQMGHKDGSKIVASLHFLEGEAEHLTQALLSKGKGFFGKRMVIAGDQAGSTIVDPSNTVPGGNHAALPTEPLRPSQTVEKDLPQGELAARGMQAAPGSTDAAKASASPASATTTEQLDGTSESNTDITGNQGGKPVLQAGASDNA